MLTMSGIWPRRSVPRLRDRRVSEAFTRASAHFFYDLDKLKVPNNQDKPNMQVILSRKAVVAFTAALLGMGTLSTSITAVAQESTIVKKSAAIKADFKLERAVQKAFDQEKHFDSSDIRVVARKGVVTLDGTMPDDKQIQKASELATATPGVKSVTNSLTLKEAGH